MPRLFDSALEQFADMFRGLPAIPHCENLYDPATALGKIRRKNLLRYLHMLAETEPSVVLIGEAPGYQGTRRTGIPFASEHMISGGMPEISFFHPNPGFEIAFSGERIYREPTSTVMWRTISACPTLPLLWAVFPLHPHQPGNVASNRTPTSAEVKALQPILTEFLRLFTPRRVLSLGNTAKNTLDSLGVTSEKLRHPARGGGPVFARQLHEALDISSATPRRDDIHSVHPPL